MDGDLVTALRSRRVETITATEADLIGNPDEDHLAFATAHDCVLYSFNISDFCRIQSHCIAAAREHGGIILAPQQKFSVGEQMRRLLRFTRPRLPRVCAIGSSSSATGFNNPFEGTMCEDSKVRQKTRHLADFAGIPAPDAHAAEDL